MVLYFIALIQNESEMMRYSWADVRPAIDNMGYSFDSYTAENLALFFVELARKKYDAVIIAANACNDSNVLEGLKANKEIIEGYLKSGGGLLISFQMRLASYDSYGFLPEEYEIKAINRIVFQNAWKMKIMFFITILKLLMKRKLMRIACIMIT